MVLTKRWVSSLGFPTFYCMVQPDKKFDKFSYCLSLCLTAGEPGEHGLIEVTRLWSPISGRFMAWYVGRLVVW